MIHTTTDLSRKVPKCLPFLIIITVTATLTTRYLIADCRDPALTDPNNNDTTAVAAIAAHARFPADALRVSGLNQVPLDYGYAYNVYRSRGYSLCPPASQRGYLHLHRRVDCRALFKEVRGVRGCGDVMNPGGCEILVASLIIVYSVVLSGMFWAVGAVMHSFFTQVLADQSGQLLPTPPQFLPSIYRNEYLLDGHVELQSLPKSEVYNGNPKPLEWAKVGQHFMKVGHLGIAPTTRAPRTFTHHRTKHVCIFRPSGMLHSPGGVVHK